MFEGLTLIIKIDSEINPIPTDNGMGKYLCEKCGKEMTRKLDYTAHVKNNLCDTLTPIPTPMTGNNETKINTNDNQVVGVQPKIPIPKPILKWVGGKTQIMDTLIQDFPTCIHNYREIFLGGGSVLLSLLSYVKHGMIKVSGQIYAYDLNEPLVSMYQNIQSHHTEVYSNLQTLIQEFGESGGESGHENIVNRSPATLEEAKLMKENYYYWIRSEYNRLSLNEKKTPRGSAMFIFLNKTCFRGVFRVGPRGFNVPYGHYPKSEIVKWEHLEEIHSLIQGVVFECCDFSSSLGRVEVGDFVYLDPPYAPENATSFVGYTENGFPLEKHRELFSMIHGLGLNKKIMLSNADVSLVRENFLESDHYQTLSILCRRAIHSKNPESKAKEVIIRNY